MFWKEWIRERERVYRKKEGQREMTFLDFFVKVDECYVEMKKLFFLGSFLLCLVDEYDEGFDEDKEKKKIISKVNTKMTRVQH